jgi:hypothetical protein
VLQEIISHDQYLTSSRPPRQCGIPSDDRDQDGPNEHSTHNKEACPLPRGPPATPSLSSRTVSNRHRASLQGTLNAREQADKRGEESPDDELGQIVTVSSGDNHANKEGERSVQSREDANPSLVATETRVLHDQASRVKERPSAAGQALLTSASVQESTSRSTVERSKNSKYSITDQVAGDTLNSAKTGGRAVGPALPEVMHLKIGRIGSLDVLEDLKRTIKDLRTSGCPLPKADQQPIPNHLEDQPFYTQRLWLLKEQLELVELNEQIFRLHKRLALAEFFNIYVAAQIDIRILFREGKVNVPKQRTRKRGRKRDANSLEAGNSHCNRMVLNRFIDLLFPNAIDSSKKGPTERGWTRRAAGQKIRNWRKAGKPWAHMVKRFGKGILLLLPQDLTDAE